MTFALNRVEERGLVPAIYKLSQRDYDDLLKEAQDQYKGASIFGVPVYVVNVGEFSGIPIDLTTNESHLLCEGPWGEPILVPNWE